MLHYEKEAPLHRTWNHTNPPHAWSAWVESWPQTDLESKVNKSHLAMGTRLAERSMWSSSKIIQSKQTPWTSLVAKQKNYTHLSAHGTVDSNDDKALNRVEDSKEDLEQRNDIPVSNWTLGHYLQTMNLQWTRGKSWCILNILTVHPRVTNIHEQTWTAKIFQLTMFFTMSSQIILLILFVKLIY